MKIPKLTYEECFSFLLDEDNKELYPNLYIMIEFYIKEEDDGRSQYLIEHTESHPDYDNQ